jgi:hypothetical protein
MAMRRIARALGIVVSPVAGELRRLNRIGAGAASRGVDDNPGGFGRSMMIAAMTARTTAPPATAYAR